MRSNQLFRKVVFNMNYYQQLELPKNCLPKDIKKQYLKLAKIYHPDVYQGDDKERFNKIKEAYDTLRVPEQRRKYDQQLSDQDQNEDKSSSSGNYKFHRTEERNEHSEEMYDIKQEQQNSEEYAKFRNQKIKVKPDQIHIQEDQMLRQMNQKERLQYEYTHFKNNKEMYYVKYAHQNSYEEILDDNINIMNERHKESKVNHKKRRAFFESYMKYVANAGLVLFAVLTLPAVISTARTRRDIAKERERQQRLQEQREKVMSMLDVQSRIVFD